MFFMVKGCCFVMHLTDVLAIENGLVPFGCLLYPSKTIKAFLMAVWDCYLMHFMHLTDVIAIEDGAIPSGCL